jgi:bifunctional non-homologous end joining protein LigD
MAATLSAVLPEDDDAWGYEVKWDGVRTIARLRDGKLRLTSRSQRDVTATYLELSGLVTALDGQRVIIVGEVVALDDKGRPSFQQLQPRMNVKDFSALLPSATTTRTASSVTRAVSAPSGRAKHASPSGLQGLAVRQTCP